MWPCFEKNQLMLKYSKALRTHGDAVSLWVAKANAGGGNKEVQSLQEAAKEARYAAEDARHELESHIDQHGC
jgi:hypothetical protein